MRKRILKWLFGKDFKYYFELLDDHTDTLKRCREEIKENIELRKKINKRNRRAYRNNRFNKDCSRRK